jgi:tetratricopeptide (TPR) repeat protein
MVCVARSFLILAVSVAVAVGSAGADVARDASVCSDPDASFDAAIEACSGVIDQAGISEEIKYAALTRRAQSYFGGRGDFARALDDATAAIKLRPDEADGYALRGGMFLAFNEFERAIADFGEILRRKPGDVETLASRAFAYVQLGDSEKAIGDYNEVIRLRPDDASAIYDRGGAFEKMEKFDLARADYVQAIKLRPDYAGEFPEGCYGANDKGERVLASWPACEGE